MALPKKPNFKQPAWWWVVGVVHISPSAKDQLWHKSIVKGEEGNFVGQGTINGDAD